MNRIGRASPRSNQEWKPHHFADVRLVAEHTASLLFGAKNCVLERWRVQNRQFQS